MNKYLKLSMKIEFFDKGLARFEILYVCPEIHESNYVVLFQSKRGYVFEKFSGFKYKMDRMLLPFKIERNKKYTDVINFKNDRNRYEYLKKLSEDLKEFSKCDIFCNIEKTHFSHKLRMDKNCWFLY